MAKKFDVVGTGYVPCNKRRFQGEIILYRPCYGIVSVEAVAAKRRAIRGRQNDE